MARQAAAGTPSILPKPFCSNTLRNLIHSNRRFKDEPQNQHAEKRPEHGADAPGQEGAPDDDGGDGVQFKAKAAVRVAGLGVERVNDPPSAEPSPLKP